VGSFTIRALDLVISFAALAILSPIVVLLICLGTIVFRSPFFLQKRIGQWGVVFIIFKLRTLPISTPIVPTHELNHAEITQYGKFLRRSKLDEVPQLLNVILGQMSLVGPRPCLPSQTEIIRLREVSGVLASKPGITGLAQLQNIHMEYPEQVVDQDRKMQSEMNAGLYLKILLATTFKILYPKLRGLK
jgi:O-antigen biosynthesis protein WbqP